MKTTEEKNRMIAEFMGLGFQLHLIEDPKTGEYVDPEFQTSWDWLMPVVEKIDTMDDYRFTVRMMWHYTEIHDNTEVLNIVDAGESGERLMNTYNAVCEFIEWYNENKEK